MVNIIQHEYIILDEYKTDGSDDATYVFTFREVAEYDKEMISDLSYLLQDVFNHVNWAYSVEVNLKHKRITNRDTIKVLVGVFTGLMEKECSYCKLILPASDSVIMNLLIQSSVNAILSCARIKHDVVTLETPEDSSQNVDEI